MTGITIVLLAVWLTAAVFTKFATFAMTREFLERQTLEMAESWIELASAQSLAPAVLEGSPNQVLFVWQNGTPIIKQGGDQIQSAIEKPEGNDQRIAVLSGSKWIVATRCKGQVCVWSGMRDQNRQYAVRWIIVSIFVPLFFIFGLITIGAYYSMRFGLRPLRELTKHVAQIDLEKLEPLPHQKRAKEIAPLANAVNMLIQKMNDQLARERSFLDACAHEIRTPIAGLIAQIQSLDIDPKSYPQDEALVHRHSAIHKSALKTIRIANQFLTLAKTKNTLADLSNVSRFDLCELVRVTTADMLIPSGNVEIQMVGQDSILVETDPFAIELIVQNIIDNALRYGTAKKGVQNRIVITCSISENVAIIQIEDNGSGTPEADLDKLSRRFYRCSRTDNNSTINLDNATVPIGAGLGLSIVKEVAETCRGTLELSKSPTLGGLRIAVSLDILAGKTKR